MLRCTSALSDKFPALVLRRDIRKIIYLTEYWPSGVESSGAVDPAKAQVLTAPGEWK